MRTKLSACLLAAAVALAQAPALAGPTEDAKVLFNVGAQAYEKGKYPAAIEAFEQAYRLAPRPGIVFSMGQAHRKLYYTGGRHPEDLRAAIAAYREYLAKVDQGGRRADASEALAELEALAAKLDPGAPAAAVMPPPPPAATRLMVTSQIAEAVISLDGQKGREVPLVADVTPGKHVVKVSAAGYFEETRTVEVAAGSTIPLDIALREQPGKLTVHARDGAQVSLDGRFVANTPLTQAIDVEPGRHLVSVAKNGYRPLSQEIELGRAEARTLDAPLEATTQRSVSYVLMGVGAAGLVAGGALAAISVYHMHQAQDFDAQRTSGKLSCSTTEACTALFKQYTDQVGQRDDFRRNSGIVLGAGVAVGAVGVALFAFDFPSLLGATSPRDKAKTPAAPAPRERSMEASVAPMIAPGLYGGSVLLRF